MGQPEKGASKGDFLDELTELATSVNIETIPPAVCHAGRRALVDTIASILAGMNEPQLGALASQMVEASIAPCCTILSTPHRADPMWAALVNGTAGVWHELDGGNRFAAGHPAVYAVSAGIAVGEQTRSSGKRLLEAIIAGYEVGTRIGLGTTLKPGMDSHGSWLLVGAATAAGLLMGYGQNELRETINVSTSLNLATSSKAAYQGATIRNVYAGFGSAMGVLAADLVQDGFTGETDGVSTVFGNIAGVYFDIEKVVEDIGKRWEIERGYHKRRACTRSIDPALDALIRITEKDDIGAAEVERIEVRTSAMAATMSNVSPDSALAAKFSIPYAVASYLVLGETGIKAYCSQALRDPRIKGLASRVVVKNDLGLDAQTPAERPAEVRVELRDGRKLEASVHLPAGEFDMEPVSDTSLNEKFRALASSSVGPDKAKILLDKLWSVEKVSDIVDITILCERVAEQVEMAEGIL